MDEMALTGKIVVNSELIFETNNFKIFVIWPGWSLVMAIIGNIKNFSRIVGFFLFCQRWRNWWSRVRLQNFCHSRNHYRFLWKKLPQKKNYVWATPLNFSWIMKFWQFLRFQMAIWFWQLLLNGLKYCHFFVIFVENDVLYILEELESDPISPRESPKNGRIGAHRLNFEIFVNSELLFEIYDENFVRISS